MDWNEIIDPRDIMEKLFEVKESLKQDLTGSELRRIGRNLDYVRANYKKGRYGRSMDTTIELDCLCGLIHRMITEASS